MRRRRYVLLPVACVLAAGVLAASGAAASGVAASRGVQAGTHLAGHRAHHKSLAGRSSPATATRLGRFKHPKPPTFDHDQFGLLKLPKGPFRRLPRNKPTVASKPGGVAGVSLHAEVSRGSAGDPAPTIDMLTADAVPYSGFNPEEPTTAAVRNTVVYTSNDQISFSVNGGHSFVNLNPRTMYKDDPAGGPDGDQDVIYVPQIGEFVWLIQYFAGSNGANLDRLAVFPPSAVNDAGLTSWTYWDITGAMLPGVHSFLDFPDLAFGDKYLYLTQDGVVGGHPDQTFIARIGLSNLAHGLNLGTGPEAWRYVLGGLFFGKVVQQTGGVAYWASNSSNSTMAASYWPESSTTWTGPVTVNVDSWPNSSASYATTFPDGTSWLNLYKGAVEGSVRIGGDLYFAWTAGKGSGRESWLKQPNVQLVEMTTGFKFVSQRAIWNSSYVYAWPNLTAAPNSKGVGQLGISLVWGGGKYYANASVGDLTTSPYLLDTTVTSNADCKCGRWGDYLAVRPYYGPATTAPAPQFVATGFGYDAKTGYDDVYGTFTG
jgi:hypothetical protein